MKTYTYRELVEEIRRNPEFVKVAEALGLKVDYKRERKLVLCPFHEDHDPSMQLFDDHYHCWSCNAHGDVFELVKQLNNLTFKEAVKWLAEFQGLLVPGYTIKSGKLPGEFRNGLEFGYALYKKNANDSTLKEWCKKRKIDYSTVKNSGILSLDRNPLTSEIKGLSSKYSSNEWGALGDAGLVKFIRPAKYKKDGKTFLDLDSVPKDVFWYRSILFPIYDQYGKPQGFAARVNNDKDYKGPKYLYTRGFKRSENLYGIDKVFENVRSTLKESKKQRGLKSPFNLFVTEGFMDALRLRSLGFNAVAVLGSAVSGKIDESNSQLGLLKKLADTLKDIPLAIHLFLDNDNAGHNGMNSALPQMLKLKRKSDNVVSFDIILPGSEYPGKDPDELLKDIPLQKDADNLLKSWSRPVLDFVITVILDCHVDELESVWEKLTALQKAQLKRRIEFSIPPGDETLCESTFDKIEPKDTPWKKLYLLEYPKDKKILQIEIPESEISEHDFQKALMLAEQRYTGPDFPVDFGSWERLKKAGSLLHKELNNHLKNSELLESCIPLFMPRDGGGSPRLLVLPCVEDLVLQEYVLNKLLTFALNNDGIIPAVIHNPDLNKPDLDKDRNLITVGMKEHIPANGKTVSFAYQVNASALRAGGDIRTATFRHFSKCWRSFNDFILARISSSPQEVLFPARLDIRRFYDRIPQYAVMNVLKPALEAACKKESDSPLVPGIDSGKVKDRATQIFEWICRHSFQYLFYSPENGSRLEWHDTDRGIPQGPNLSAWLANIVLFPVDKRLSEEVEKINEEYRSEHPGCSEEDIVATYARYVDDVILIAPDNNTLVRLKQFYASEIDKIGLTLNPKTDPMEPQKVIQLREWLLENRGFGERPSGPWNPSSLRFTGSVFRSIWVQTIDRREALALLHDQDIDRGGFSKEDIKHILETVCQKSEEIRYRDYRQVSKRLWQIVGDEFTGKGNFEEIIEKYKKEWENLIKQDEEEVPEGSNKGTIIDNYRIPLRKTWHLQVCLEGIQALLLSRMDRAHFIDDKCRNIHAERRRKIAEWVLEGIVDSLIDKIGIEEGYVEKFKFTLELRRLTLIQIAGMVTGKTDFTSRFEGAIKFGEESGEEKTLNAITRFSYRSLKPEKFESLRTYTTFDKLAPILLFHEVIERLCSGNDNTTDPLKSIRDSCERYRKEQGTFLANALFYLCPSNNNDGDVSDGKESDAIFAALQVFANCVSVDRQLNLLKDRKPLLKCLLNDNNKDLYILPHPEGLTLKTIQVMEISADRKIAKRYLLFKTQLNEDQDIQNMLDFTLPEPEKEWTVKENDTCIEGIKCYSQEDKSYSLPVLKYIPQKKDPEKRRDTLENISILYNAFNDLVEISYIDRYLITPFHIVKNENAYSLFSPQYDLSEEFRTLAFASENYSGLLSAIVHAKNAHLWRIGIALAGLLDLFKESSDLVYSRIQRDSVNSSNREECLAQALLRQALYILSGGKWWSKPKPVRETEAEDTPVQKDTKLPRAVEDCLKNLKRFLDFPGFEEKLAIWLVSWTDSLLITLCHDTKQHQAAGGFVHICSKLATQVLYANVFILNELAAFSVVANDYSEYRRSVACCRKMIEILDGLSKRIKNKESKESLRKLKAAFRIRAINNYFKSLALELRKKANNTFADCYNSLQQDLKIFESDNEVLLSEQLGTNSDHLQFYENLDRNLKKTDVTAQGFASITPAGWIIAAWTVHCCIVQGEQKSNLKELGKEIISIYEKLVFCSHVQDGNYPWLIDDDSLKDIEASFEETFINEKHDKTLSKRIDDFASLKSKFCRSNRYPLSDDKEYFSFSTMDSGDWNLKPWQINIEILPGDKQDKFENESDEGKRVTYWTETWHKETLVSVSLLTESYGILFHPGDDKSATIEQDKSKTARITSQKNEDDKKPEQEKVDELEEQEKLAPGEDEAQSLDGTERPSPKGVVKDSLEEFKKWQEILWNGRKHRFGQHIRVALCQWDLDESYSHPLREICGCKNKEIYDEIKKKNFTITELKKKPWNYNGDLGLKNTKEGTQPKKLRSCAEYRRRKILDEAFRACKHFNVDLLLLPEYSVRPETVEWIKGHLKNDRYSDISLTVWCGTYRLPYWDGGRVVDDIKIDSMTSPIHVISRNHSFVRWKKYPAVAFAEFFKPYQNTIEPLHISQIGKDSTQRYYPGDYVSELICSENFALTSPANRNAILQAYYQLEHIWGITGRADLSLIKEVLDTDLEFWSRWSSLSPSLEDKDELDWMKYTPRRTVLFVPSMTTRAADYHILGQANLLAAGICTVFCNAVGEHSDGGSCFVGHGSWSNRHNSSEYYDDRLGPYNGVFPGIYRSDQKNDGALGSKDQALVIADIDPVYMNEGKPRQQLLQHPLQLVAHLPIIEVSDHQQYKSKENKVDCACERKREGKIDKFLEEALKIKKILKEQKKDHMPEVTISNFLKKLSSTFKKDSWFEERENAYKRYSMAKPCELPPPAIYDWLVVFSDIQDSSIELPRIEVPPFTCEKDRRGKGTGEYLTNEHKLEAVIGEGWVRETCVTGIKML